MKKPAICSRPRSRRAATALLAALLLAACSTPPPRAYQSENFPTETPFQYYSNHKPEEACEIGKRALLSQGYLVDDPQPRSLRGEKYFRQLADQATKLSITLVCLPSDLGAVIYANAMETQYELRASSSSAGVSVSGFGSLSMPWSADKNTQVKVGEATVTATDFYEKLFELIKSLDS